MDFERLINPVEFRSFGTGVPVTHHMGSEYQFYWLPVENLDNYCDIVNGTEKILHQLKMAGLRDLPSDPVDLISALSVGVAEDGEFARVVSSTLNITDCSDANFLTKMVLSKMQGYFIGKLFATALIVDDEENQEQSLQIKFSESDVNEVNNGIAQDLIINCNDSPFYDQFSEVVHLLVNKMIDKDLKVLDDGFRIHFKDLSANKDVSGIIESLGFEMLDPKRNENGLTCLVRYMELLK